jgi:hypothetical protein
MCRENVEKLIEKLDKMIEKQTTVLLKQKQLLEEHQITLKILKEARETQKDFLKKWSELGLEEDKTDENT